MLVYLQDSTTTVFCLHLFYKSVLNMSFTSCISLNQTLYRIFWFFLCLTVWYGFHMVNRVADTIFTHHWFFCGFCHSIPPFPVRFWSGQTVCQHSQDSHLRMVLMQPHPLPATLLTLGLWLYGSIIIWQDRSWQRKVTYFLLWTLTGYRSLSGIRSWRISP